MSSIKVTGSTKETIVATGERQLTVTAVITDGDSEIVVKRGFPLTATKDDVVSDLQKTLELYDAEKARKVENESSEQAEASADETIEALTDLEITG